MPCSLCRRWGSCLLRSGGPAARCQNACHPQDQRDPQTDLTGRTLPFASPRRPAGAPNCLDARGRGLHARLKGLTYFLLAIFSKPIILRWLALSAPRYWGKVVCSCSKACPGVTLAVSGTYNSEEDLYALPTLPFHDGANTSGAESAEPTGLVQMSRLRARTAHIRAPGSFRTRVHDRETITVRLAHTFDRVLRPSPTARAEITGGYPPPVRVLSLPSNPRLPHNTPCLRERYGLRYC